MATPIADAYVLQFRREYKDLRDSSDGSVITTSTQDGTAFSAVDVKNMLVNACNKLLEIGYQALYDVNAFADTFDEYKRVTDPALAGTFSDNIFTVTTMPADFSMAVSGIYVPNSGAMDDIILVNSDRFNDAVVDKNPEQRASYLGAMRNKTFEVVHNTATLTNSDTVILTYMALQPDITLGGATDIRMRTSRMAEIMQLMHEMARLQDK